VRSVVSEKAAKMPGSREKGKIARSEWSKIVARYEAGDTIAQLGRDYGCTGPAIRYIIKRTGAFHATAEGDRTVSPSSQRGRLPTPRAELGGSRVRASPPASAAVARALGHEMGKRVSADIASFLVALDQAVVGGSPQHVADLQETTDRLMRSIARVRLELDRLVADEKMPKSARAITAQSAGARRS
jgi:hypothetical protein